MEYEWKAVNEICFQIIDKEDEEVVAELISLEDGNWSLQSKMLDGLLKIFEANNLEAAKAISLTNLLYRCFYKEQFYIEIEKGLRSIPGND